MTYPPLPSYLFDWPMSILFGLAGVLQVVRVTCWRKISAKALEYKNKFIVKVILRGGWRPGKWFTSTNKIQSLLPLDHNNNIIMETRSPGLVWE